MEWIKAQKWTRWVGLTVYGVVAALAAADIIPGDISTKIIAALVGLGLLAAPSPVVRTPEAK